MSQMQLAGSMPVLALKLKVMSWDLRRTVAIEVPHLHGPYKEGWELWVLSGVQLEPSEGK